MTPLHHLRVLEFKGNDASQFLQAQLSGDIAAIPPGKAGFGACCNPAGRVLGLLLVRPEPHGCMAVCPAGLVQPLSDWLRKFVLRADVAISTRTDLEVVGGEAADFPGATVLRTKVDSFTYSLVPGGTSGDVAESSLKQDWQAREIASGITWLGPETSGRFLPQMLGLESIGALSFNKGCYPGQEVIARTRYLGKLKRRPVQCRLDKPFDGKLMEEVTLRGEGREANGVVVDCARHLDGATRLLVVARITEPFAISSLVLGTLQWTGAFEFPS